MAWRRRRTLKEKGMDTSFGSFTRFPDLLMMDGGRGQVNIALEVLGELRPGNSGLRHGKG